MKTRTIIEHSQFRQMLSYKPYVTLKTDKQAIKNELKDSIINFYIDKWYRLKEATRAAVDFLCFTSVELGFCYASQGYLANFGVSERTIRRIMNDLQKAGIVYIAYRRLGHFNACGKPVYFFTKHAYFDYWCSFLGLGVQPSNLVNGQVENAGNVDATRFDTDNQVSTYSLTENQQEKEFKETYVGGDVIDNNINDADYISENIPKPFVNLVKTFFPINHVYEYWRMVNVAYNQNNLDNDTRLDTAILAFKQMVGKLRYKVVKNPVAYFTGILKRKFDRQFINECIDMGMFDNAPDNFNFKFASFTS